MKDCFINFDVYTQIIKDTILILRVYWYQYNLNCKIS